MIDASRAVPDDDRAELDGIVQAFFSAFTSGSGIADRMAMLRSLFLPQALIVRTCGGEPTVYGVDGFIAPRAELLSGGSLLDFSEWPVSGQLEVFGDIAHWFGAYSKKGVQDGVRLAGRGMKSVQFVRTGAGWRISAVVWDDERAEVDAAGS